MATITKASAEALQPGQIMFDSKLPGFGVRCQRAARTYFIKARIKGRQRWITIGRHGAPWTPDAARARAKALLGEIAKGQDPATVRDAESAAGTFAELADRYLAEWAASRKKSRSAEADRINLRLNILPQFGRRRVTDIARADVAKLHHDLRRKPGAANRCLSLLHKMFELAEMWGLRPEGSNPVRKIERYPSREIERFLSATEMARIGAVLKRAEIERIALPTSKRDGMKATGGENPYLIAAIRLLMLTGARLSEILSAQWEFLKVDSAALELPDSKSGAKVVPLGAPALAVLSKLPRISGNPFILPGHVRGSHLKNLNPFWRAVCESADIKQCRIHDLRHSFASVGAAAGDSLLLIGKLLGHSQAQTTHRYAHLAPNPVLAAADRIAGNIAAAMNGNAGQVVKMTRSRGRARASAQ